MMWKKIFKPSFWLTNVKALQAFQILRQGSVILIAILLAKSSLPLSSIGNYEMLLYIGFTATAFWITGLAQGFLARYPQLEEKEQPSFLWSAYLVFLGLGILIGGILLLGKTTILQFLAGQAEVPHYELFVLFLCIQVPSFLVENIYLILKRPAQLLAYGVTGFIVQTSAVLLPVFLGYGLYWAIWGLVLTAIVKHCWLLYILFKDAQFSFQQSIALNWVYLSFPLAMYALIGGFHVAFDNWLVNYAYHGNEDMFAIFRYGARELPIALALSGAFGTALLPEVAASLETGMQQIKEKSLKLFHLLFPISIILILSNKWLFPLVFSSDFGESVIIFNIFLLITISRLIFSRTILVGLNENKVIFFISLLELPINIVLSWVLVPYWGLAGIAAGTVIAYSFEKVGLCWFLYKKYGVSMHRYINMKWFWGYTLLLLLSFLISL